MPLKDENLTREFNLREVDLEKLQSEGWSDQGSTNYHYGLTRKKNLWVKRINTDNHCDHVVIWLFVFLHLSTKHAIKKVETSVHQVFNDGSYDEFEVPFFPPDQETAAQEIRGILK
jgi:hypothetical protein